MALFFVARNSTYVTKQFMTPIITGFKKQTAEVTERFFTAPVVILMLLMMTFIGTSFYLLISTILS